MTSSNELIARRPSAETAITSAREAIEVARAAKEAALEAEDRKAHAAAQYDLERSSLALTKATKALEALNAEIAAALQSETVLARDAAQVQRDDKLAGATDAAKAEAAAFLDALKHRLVRQELSQAALAHQAECEHLSSALGETFFSRKTIDPNPGIYEAARELVVMMQASGDPRLAPLVSRLILDLAPNFQLGRAAV